MSEVVDSAYFPLGLRIRLAQPTVKEVEDGWKRYGNRVVAGGLFAIVCLACLGHQVVHPGEQPDQWAIVGFAALGVLVSTGLLTWFVWYSRRLKTETTLTHEVTRRLNENWNHLYYCPCGDGTVFRDDIPDATCGVDDMYALLSLQARPSSALQQQGPLRTGGAGASAAGIVGRHTDEAADSRGLDQPRKTPIQPPGWSWWSR